ncbi:hypothetical protein ACTID9_23370 [Brevibacillus fluminis]
MDKKHIRTEVEKAKQHLEDGKENFALNMFKELCYKYPDSSEVWLEHA